MSNTDLYSIFCAHGRSHFESGHHANAEVLKFHSMADREEYLDRANSAAHGHIVAWSVTSDEAAKYVNLDCYALNERDEVYRTDTGIALFRYNARQIF